MASSGVSSESYSSKNSNNTAASRGPGSFEHEKERGVGDDDIEGETGSPPPSYDNTHRKLKSRHIQLIGIGGTIGTALYVQIGTGLLKGGPASLFIAFTFWSCVILSVNNAMSEMVSFMPITSPFVRFAGRFVDEGFGVATGWNFFVFEAAMVTFEIVACTQILSYWGTSDHVPDAAIITICIVLYATINMVMVEFYGESEFWLALGKLLLIIGLIAFTFVTMLGGNPDHDAYGFRYWKDPGPFAEHYTTGSLGRFMGFMACVIQASFTIAGPEYVSISAGEAENARVTMPRAFKAVFYRLAFFFVVGSLAVGIVVPYNDREMADAYLHNLPGAASSPYVVAMDRLRIRVLPNIVNALILSSAFSAGNSYVYCASRCLYGLALDGHAPKLFTRCTRKGVPIYAVLMVLAIALLSFLQVSNSAAVVLSWFVSLVTASQLINFSAMSVTYIFFLRALKAQGISRDDLPHKSPWQPYTTYFALTCTTVMCVVGGYEVFLPGNWNVPTFLFGYTMVAVFPILYVTWKWVKGAKVSDPVKVNIFREERQRIDDYEKTYVPTVPRNVVVKYWDKLFG